MAAYDIAYMKESLRVDGFSPAEKLDWLENTYKDPKTFFSELLTQRWNHLNLSGKSVAFRHYDFYYDIFHKKKLNADIAYIYYDFNSRRHEVTYAALAALVDQKTAEWISKGVAAGNVIGIVYPVGLEYLVAVLSALKIGCIFSVISPKRPYLMKKQLASLAPDFITTSPLYAALLKPFQDKIAEQMPAGPDGMKKGAAARSHVFKTGEPAARLFDYTTDTPLVPVDVPCDALYLNAVRDGLLALHLAAGNMLAAPGFENTSSQPFLLLSVLFSHAAFLDIKTGQYQKKPDILTQDPIHVIGVNNAFRDFVLEKKIPVFASCRFWFRAPAAGATAEPNEWLRFIEKMDLKKQSNGVIKWHISTGGALFFSRLRKEMVLDNLLPSAGTRFSLANHAEMPPEEAARTGNLSAGITDVLVRTPYLVTQNLHEWLFLGSAHKEKKGRYFPMEMVEGFVREFSGFNYCFITPVTDALQRKETFDLVIFSGAAKKLDTAATAHRIQKKIEQEMGEEYCPDIVTFFPLLPRFLTDGSMDVKWCKEQYIDKRLPGRSGNRIFKGLSLLKEYLLLQHGAPPTAG